MRVLIADDEETLLLVLSRQLESMGHEVSVASDGLEAWRLLRAGRFPLVISDWMMPGIDGPSLCRRIRGAEDDFYTYVILLTSRVGSGDRMEALKAGADDFLQKPIDPEELAVRLEIARRILGVQARLEEQKERFEELARTDGLTGLKNRREFQRALNGAFAVASRQEIPLSLVLLDVDHFKDFNDSFGHLRGDDVLREIGSVLAQNCREHETAARYGGEEFALILLGASPSDARATAERLRKQVAAGRWLHRPVTASFGIASLNREVTTGAELTERADQALYLSKQRGRNRVTDYDDENRTRLHHSSPWKPPAIPPDDDARGAASNRSTHLLSEPRPFGPARPTRLNLES